MSNEIRRKGMFVLLFAFIFMFSACGEAGPAGGDTGAAAATGTGAVAVAPDDVPSFRVVIGRPAIIEDLQTNDVSLWLEEHTGIFVQYDQIPMEGINERVALLIAGGDLPDAFMHANITAAQITQFGILDNQFIPLDDLIDAYIPNLEVAMNFYDRGLDLLRQVDGQIWGLPAINPCFHCMHAQRMWVNEDWRNTLGIPVPTTIDEFYNMLVAFRDMDPNGNGVGDEIPLSGAMNGWHTQSHFFLMQSFLPFDNVQQGFMIDENENVVNRVTDLRFRDGLRFINRLHEEGLMYAGTLIQDNDVLRMQMMNPDIDIVGAAAAGFHGVLGEIGTERMRKYMPIRPLIGPGGQNAWSSLQEPIDNRLVITTTAPDPGLIARWANYFYTYEVTGALYNGLEGVGWRWAEPGEVGFDGHQAMWFALMPYFAGMGGQRNDVWTQLGIFNYSFDWRVGQAVDPDVDLWSPEGLENVLHIVTEQYMEPFNWNNLILPRINLSADEFNVIGTVRTEWNTFFDEAVFNFVTGVWNLDSDWYNFVDNVYGIYRMNEMLAVYQTAFDRAYRR